VSPGVVLTDALQHFDEMNKEGTIEKTIRLTPAGRLVTADEIAKVVDFLCSPAAEMIRGQIITVDGGITLLAPGVTPPSMT
jgi:enoyl-[acyl-carrier protein] reductase III